MTRAAERMNITQPAMSFQIRELEKEIQLSLFDRDRNGIYLTDAGKVMRDGFVRILDSYHHLLEDARACVYGKVRLTIGFHGPISWAGITQFVASFSARHPDIDVVLLQQQWKELADYLELGALDVAFLETAELPGRNKLSSHSLFRENTCFAISPSHRLAKKNKVSVEELTDETIFMNNHPSGSMSSLIRRLQRSGIKQEQFRFFDQADITLAMAAAGQGLASIPLSFRSETTALRYVEYNAEACRMDYSIAWNRSSENSARHLFVEDVLHSSWPYTDTE